jgi:hypothetical protein
LMAIIMFHEEQKSLSSSLRYCLQPLLLPCKSKYLPQHLGLKHGQPIFFP